MIVTFDKHTFYVRADNGLIRSSKTIPEEIQSVMFQGNLITVITNKGTLVYKQVGTSPVFNFFRRY